MTLEYHKMRKSRGLKNSPYKIMAKVFSNLARDMKQFKGNNLNPKQYKPKEVYGRLIIVKLLKTKSKKILNVSECGTFNNRFLIYNDEKKT